MSALPRGLIGGISGRSKYRITVRNLHSVLKSFKYYETEVTRKIRRQAKAIGIEMEAETKRLWNSAYYQKPWKTGYLMRSITSKVTESKRTEFTILYGTKPHYAVYVHEGTKYMKERPALADALRNKKKWIEERIKEAFYIKKFWK